MRIYTEFDGTEFVLMCADGKMAPTPAGPRLFRQPPYPDIKFTHDSMETAQIDEGKLRTYLKGVEK